MNDINELNDEDLEKVSGGTSYSGSTYQELNIGYNHEYQVITNHPVITTIGNTCKLSKTSCNYCGQFRDCISIFSGYCLARSREYDPAK